MENTKYTVKEAPTDLQEAATALDQFMSDFDPYEYRDADYNVEQALYDIDNDPGMVIMELIRIANELYDLAYNKEA